MFRADLHCHTTCSDGTLPPEALVAYAVERGLQGLAITDHDTVEAFGRALPEAKRLGLQLMSGVEFSTVFEETVVHVLGYAFDLKSPLILDLCDRHRQRRQDRMDQMVKKLRRLGFEVPLMKDEGVLGRPHLAQALVDAGHVASIDEAFKKYLGDGRSCFVPGAAFSVEETLEVIHGAGGLAVIAHPMLVKKTSCLKRLYRLPFDGIEAFYARWPRHQEQRWIDVAKSRDWLITGGSDFHGSIKPRIDLGCSWVQEEVFTPLYERFLENNRD